MCRQYQGPSEFPSPSCPSVMSLPLSIFLISVLHISEGYSEDEYIVFVLEISKIPHIKKYCVFLVEHRVVGSVFPVKENNKRTYKIADKHSWSERDSIPRFQWSSDQRQCYWDRCFAVVTVHWLHFTSLWEILGSRKKIFNVWWFTDSWLPCLLVGRPAHSRQSVACLLYYASFVRRA
jgi:hypothetical protein